MTRFHRRKQPGIRENLGAGLAALGLASGVAAVTFYLVRLFLAREPLESIPPSGRDGEAGGAASGDPDRTAAGERH